MTVVPPPIIAASSPLSEEHLRQLAAAGGELRGIRRVVAVARFDGWTVGVFAGLTMLFGLTSPTALVIAAVMGGVAFVELRSAQRLERLDAGATRVLALNQAALGLLLILYALGRLYSELTGPGVYGALAASDPQLSRMLEPVKEITRTIAVVAYVGLIVVAIAAQGGLAVYYLSRRKLIEGYLRRTPAWITALHRTGVLQ